MAASRGTAGDGASNCLRASLSLLAATAPPAAVGVAADEEDVAIADLFQSQQAATLQQQHRRSQQRQQQQQQQEAQPHIRGARDGTADKRQQPPPAVRATLSPLDGGGSGSMASVAESLFAGIPGPVRRLWLLSHRSSQSHPSKRRRLNAAMVDLTADERLDEWQRAADMIAHRQPSWRSMLAHHCHLAALIDSQLPSSPLSSCSSVPYLFVRVDALLASSYSPSPLSSTRLQLAELAKRCVQAAGIVRGRLNGLDAIVDSGGVIGDLLLGYHSACLSDGRCSVTADVHDSLCRSLTGSSIGGVLSVGCYVLLRDVAVLAGSDGRPPHLVVQRYNVCAVQRPSQLEQQHDSNSSTQSHDADGGQSHTTNYTQQAAVRRSAVGPAAVAAAAGGGGSDTAVVLRSVSAAASGESSESLDSLDLGDD